MTVTAQQQIDLELLVAATTAEVAPVWPLDRAIAVNPWWQQRDRHIETIAAEQQAWFNIPMLPSEHTEKGLPFLRGSVAAVKGWRLREAKTRALPWLTEIQQQMSQFCALWVSYPEQVAQDENLGERMYKQWLNVTRHDRGIELLLNNKKVKQQLQALPCDYRELYRQAQALPLDEAQWPVYLQVLLHELYGWASVFAQRRWQRELEQQPQFNDELNQLLAIRLAWDLVCWHSVSDATRAEFQVQWASFERLKSQVQRQQQPLWQALKQREQAYQQQLVQQLTTTSQAGSHTSTPPALQAVFCIDVRSEPMRRALEAQSPAIQTFGFAGFFGLPIEYQISQGYSKPQLPGLLAPQFQVSQPSDAESQRKLQQKWRSASWHRAHESPAGAYGWVEMSGLTKAWKLLKKSLSNAPLQRVASGAMNHQPWQIFKQGQPATTQELAQLAANALTGMGLKHEFARFIMIIGHSASTQNNPHAASLECGACGGQSGAANAQVLAQLLNDKQVRQQLATEHAIAIPEHTEFLPALHDTTQQTVELLTLQQPPELSQWLAGANRLAQQEQLVRLQGQPSASAAGSAKEGSPFSVKEGSPSSVKKGSPSSVTDALMRRAGSWAEVRPEWGLARNAAIIFAPRAATQQCNFDARVFLHDYQSSADPAQQVLTQLMTAPMVVAHWINMQYYASTVAPQQFGSGNKLLHNVVADGLGVFEGNGGDIRIGLARQSIHDGKDWYHEPLRLTVVIAAEQAAIDKVISEQPMVQQLIDNEWLYLWHWQPAQNRLTQRNASGWQPIQLASNAR